MTFVEICTRCGIESSCHVNAKISVQIYCRLCRHSIIITNLTKSQVFPGVEKDFLVEFTSMDRLNIKIWWSRFMTAFATMRSATRGSTSKRGCLETRDALVDNTWECSFSKGLLSKCCIGGTICRNRKHLILVYA